MQRVQCIDDQTVLDFFGGALRAAALAAVDDHLDACAECRAVVVGLHRGQAGTPEISAPRTQLPAGTRGSADGTFSRFVLSRPLGAGAMGVVYAAYDPKLDRQIALKVLTPDAPGGRNCAGVLEEARAMAKLSHPNVVTIYDVGATGGSGFIAMELIDGPTLRAWAPTKHWRTVRDACVQAGRGLMAAHAAGLVHRDYKPDNVLVGGDRARVGDFGLATGLHQLATESVSPDAPVGSGSQTIRGVFVGTPAYMAPEVLAGSQPDPRSDQYAYCVASYEALCGAHPYPAQTLAALRRSAGVAPAKLPDGVAMPRWLLAALNRGMRRAPCDRFEDMHALLGAMQRDRTARRGLGATALSLAIVGTSVAAYGLTGSSDPSPPRCDTAAATIAEVWDPVSAAALTSALSHARPGYGALVAQVVTQAVDAWTSAWIQGHTDACEATGTDDREAGRTLDLRMACLQTQRQELAALVGALTSYPNATVDRAAESLAQLPDVRACANVEELLRVVAVPDNTDIVEAVAEVRQTIVTVRAQIRTGQFAAGAQAAQALMTAALATRYPPVIARAWLVVAAAARGQGALDHAADAAHAALRAAQQGRDDRVAAQAWVARLQIATAAGHYDEGAQLARHALAAVARVDEPPGLAAPLHNGLGVVYDNLGRTDEATAAFEYALALRRTQFGPRSTEVARVRTNLGNLARNERKYDEALAHHREALSIDREVFGERHPAIGRHLHNVARLELLTGDRDGARQHYRLALAAKQAVHGPRHVEVARTHNSLGLLLADDGDVAAARESFERALSVYADRNHPEEGIARYNLGLLSAAAADPVEALRLFRSAEAILAEASGPTSRRYVELVLAIADAELARGKRKAARTQYERAAEAAEALGDAPLVARATGGMDATANSTPGVRSKRPSEPGASAPARSGPIAGGSYAPGPGLDEL